MVEDVLEFYKVWSRFSTLKKFAYADQYKQQEGDNGRMRRAIDKENTKLRNKEKKRFNEAVWELIEYVRKNDPRYQGHMIKLEEEKQAKLEAEKARKAAIWAKNEEKWRLHQQKMEEEYANMSEEEEQFEEIFECVPCKRTFKKEG